MSLLLVNGIILLENGRLIQDSVGISDSGRIDFIGKEKDAPINYAKILDLHGEYLTPGLIDIHVHGGHGIDFDQDVFDPAFLLSYANWVVSQGVTGFLCTIMALPQIELLSRVNKFADFFEKQQSGAEFLGLHLEGPLINPYKTGAIKAECIHRFSVKEAAEVLDVSRGWLRQVTIAPEMEGAFELAAFLEENGVRAAFGHSDAGYDQACKALQGPFSHVTHMFNVMRGFHHRDPGVVGAVLNSTECTVELIADGEHVHPGAVRLLYSFLGPDRIALISDGMQAAGMPDGEYILFGKKGVVKNGKAYLEDGSLAGSMITPGEYVSFLVKELSLPLPQVLKMASQTPARILGLEERLGSIKIGSDASLVLFSESLEILKTFVKGKLVYSKENKFS